MPHPGRRRCSLSGQLHWRYGHKVGKQEQAGDLAPAAGQLRCGGWHEARGSPRTATTALQPQLPVPIRKSICRRANAATTGHAVWQLHLCAMMPWSTTSSCPGCQGNGSEAAAAATAASRWSAEPSAAAVPKAAWGSSLPLLPLLVLRLLAAAMSATVPPVARSSSRTERNTSASSLPPPA